MRTQAMIMVIVSAVALVVLGVLAALVAWLGWALGPAVWVGGLVAVLVVYLVVVKPWHLRWGATDDEVARAMPGDDLVPGAGAATRAIGIDAEPEAVWPWLVQLGYGKAGWYSYDWIDNDFRPSAPRILDEHQDLRVGDRILMMPTMGFVVTAIEPGHHIVSVLDDGSTSWCLELSPTGSGGTRLVSRWRPKLDRSPGALFMSLLAEPGTFIMEQKMLRNIRDRAERSARRGT